MICNRTDRRGTTQNSLPLLVSSGSTHQPRPCPFCGAPISVEQKIQRVLVNAQTAN